MTELQFQVSAEELALKWGVLLNNAFINIIQLEKLVKDRDQTIKELYKSETKLKAISLSLKADLDNLKAPTSKTNLEILTSNHKID